jgi:hypothetical protein
MGCALGPAQKQNKKKIKKQKNRKIKKDRKIKNVYT